MSEQAPGRRPSSFADQIYGQILRGILAGTFPVGSRLPAETALSGMFGVSRPVVREALLRLQRDGLVQSRKGSGSYVLRKPPQDIGQVTDFDLVARFRRFQDYRSVVEGAAARLAALRRSEADLARISAAHDQFCDEAQKGLFRWETDSAFHLAILAASGNEFLARGLEAQDVKLSEFMTVSLSLTRARSAARAAQVMAEHSAILAALRDQDPEAARVSMEYHLLQSARRMLDGTLAP